MPELLKELVTKDVTHGYTLVLPLSKIPWIPGALMAPMNVPKQRESLPDSRPELQVGLGNVSE